MALRGHPRRRERSAVRVIAITLTVTALIAGTASVASGAAQVEVERHWGSDRYETAAEIAETFTTEAGSVDTAIVASGRLFADALAATPLARVRNAPILLTEPDVLSDATRDFIERNGIEHVIIVGGIESISPAVESSLAAITDTAPRRLSGTNRYRTVTTIARELTANEIGDYCGDGRRTALLATGANFADALSMSPLAFAGPHPVLLTEPTRLVSTAENYLTDRDIEQVIVAGGTAAIAAAVTDSLSGMGIRVRRLWGPDRFGTAVEVAQELTSRCFDDVEFGLAYGRKFPDALVGGTLLGQRRAPLLLTGTTLPDSTRQFLAGTSPNAGFVALTVLGGPAAVTDSAADAAVSALSGDDRECNPTTDVAGAPRNLAIEPRDRGLIVTWAPPTPRGSDAPTGYTARYRSANGQWTTLGDVSSPLELDGLENTTLYEVRVRADGSSYGAWTPSGWATPSNAAGAAQATPSADSDCRPTESTA